MQTKFKEITERTSDPKAIMGKYLAERLLRKWHEDFHDEDTGEVISIERNEIIFEKGTLMLNDELSELNFYLQSKDVPDVLVSNQSRTGILSKGFTSVWSVSVKVSNKKRNYFLYANSVQMAIDVATDYLEQSLQGSFEFVSIKEVGYSNLINIEDDSDDKEFYKIEVESIFDGEPQAIQSYILMANDAEDAKESIINFVLTQSREHDRPEEFTTTIISAKTVPCNDIISFQFSQEYFDNI